MAQPGRKCVGEILNLAFIFALQIFVEVLAIFASHVLISSIHFRIVTTFRIRGSRMKLV
jgi:hypothetical protein